MIKTITLTPGEVNCIDFDQKYPYYYIKNFSASDIYASVKKFIFVADEEEVTRIPAGSTGIVYSTLASEHVNLLCAEEAKIEVIGAFERDINFTSASGGGSTGMADTYSKAELNTMLSEKVDKVEGKDLSTNDYTDEEKEKLSAITNPIKLKGKVDTVDTLPADATVGDLYFVGTDTSANYEEYVFTEDSKWEQIGTSQIDLSAYVLKEEGKGLSSNDYTDEEKTKLTSLENYTLPTASSTLGGVKTTSSVTSTSGLTACPIISGVPYYKNTTYSNATTSSNGLMSAADKTKLDGLSSSSETPTEVMIENPNANYYDWSSDECYYVKSGNVVTLSLAFTIKDASTDAKKISLPSEIRGRSYEPVLYYNSPATGDSAVESGYFTSTGIHLSGDVGDTIWLTHTYVLSN